MEWRQPSLLGPPCCQVPVKLFPTVSKQLGADVVKLSWLIKCIEIPIGRLGKPEEIAETVVWMVKTAYVTNKVIAVDGGLFVQ